jgi:periplasmic protein TonB
MSLAKLRGAAHAPAALAVIAAAILVGACSKSEPQSSTKAQPNAPLQVPQTGTAAQRAAEVDSTLQERLARQEAASKLFEKEPTKAQAPVAARAPESAKAPEAKRPEPVKAPEPPKVAAIAAPSPPPPEPAKTEAPAAPPKVDVAAAKPAAPAPAPATAKLVSRVDPEFPREAAQAGVAHGNVKARMTLDSGGNVTRVEIVEAAPRRLFDRAVVRALSQWHFTDGPSGRTVDTEVEFKLEK